MRDDTSIFPLFLNTNQKKIINPLLMFGLVGMGVGGQLAWKNQDRYEQYIKTPTLAPKIYTWRNHDGLPIPSFYYHKVFLGINGRL